MKKTVTLLAAVLLLSAIVIFAGAAGGDASDPLVSLSYLTGTFTSAVEVQVDQKLDAADVASSDGASTASATWTETRLKEGDVFSADVGTSVLLLAGSARVTYSSGAVIDVTTGSAVSSGSALAADHRYLTAEDTAAAFIVTSKTAVVDYQGSGSFRLSDATDYNAIAAALKTMHLFKGSYTGYGEGYDLEAAPTRIQALIMFIRVLGEEDAALAYTGSMPFTDVTKGTQSEKYVAYAYSQGYTNGYSATLFKPSQAISAKQYLAFMLRALGYSSGTSLSGTMETALASGVITTGELSALQSGTFLRADLVYVSYYALDAAVAGSGRTLRETLLDQGVFTAAESVQAGSLVTGSRK